MSVAEAVAALSTGGWPTNLGLSVQDALDANTDYLELIVQTDIQRVDGVRRDPDGVRRLIASYGRNVATAASMRTLAAPRNYLSASRRCTIT
jgi:hypothetical protein